jgi:hypothetical protein
MSKRKSIGKRLRFSIFSRDNFSCRYCGRQSDQVPLVIDHVVPVCQDGTNDEANLVTACVECNQGKAGHRIEQTVPTETDRLRLAQEMQEQRIAAAAAAEAAANRRARLNSLVQLWCSITGKPEVDRRTVLIIFSYVQEFGEEVVYPWIEQAYTVCATTPRFGGVDVNMGKYISGIRRNVLEQEEAA